MDAQEIIEGPGAPVRSGRTGLVLARFYAAASTSFFRFALLGKRRTSAGQTI